MFGNVEIQKPAWEPKTPSELASSLPGLGSGSVKEMTTGLNKNKIEPNGPDIREVEVEIKNMGMRKRFHMDNVEDCTERAIWCMAHLRHMFPGIPIGMVEGKMSVGQLVDKDHAVLVVWDKDLKPNYADPQQVGDPVTISPSDIKRITSIPFASDDQPVTQLEPFISIGGRLGVPKKQYVHWDTEYWIHPFDDIKKYLKEAKYENNCEGMPAHNVIRGDLSTYWKNTDSAFWAYAHLRRNFPGCAVGIAYGKAGGATGVLNVIFTENKGSIKPVYWFQPRFPPNRRGEVSNFIPEWVLF